MIRTYDGRGPIVGDEFLIFNDNGRVKHIQHDLEEHSYPIRQQLEPQTTGQLHVRLEGGGGGGGYGRRGSRVAHCDLAAEQAAEALSHHCHYYPLSMARSSSPRKRASEVSEVGSRERTKGE
jgi:hypothetical protein